jgi:hypothetical protein
MCFRRIPERLGARNFRARTQLHGLRKVRETRSGPCGIALDVAKYNGINEMQSILSLIDGPQAITCVRSLL